MISDYSPMISPTTNHAYTSPVKSKYVPTCRHQHDFNIDIGLSVLPCRMKMPLMFNMVVLPTNNKMWVRQ